MTNSKRQTYSSQNRSVEWLNQLMNFQLAINYDANNENKDDLDTKLSLAFEENQKYNQFLIKQFFSEPRERITTTIDLLMNLYFYQIGAMYASHAFFSFNAASEDVNVALTSCFVTGLQSLYTSFYLTNIGLYHPAKMNLRYSFEALFIAKFISLNRSADLFDKWIDGLTTNLTSSVFDKISKPNVSVFKYFWKELNKFSHATKYVKQETLNLPEEDAKNEITFNYQLIDSLLECYYHLLNSHVILSPARYVVEQYGDYEKVSSIKLNIKLDFKRAHKSQAKDFMQLARFYRLRWQT